ncbi:MAG TPA: chaperone modulator CbpM [Acidimicrobiia bacterium]|jgi:hypothetical protein|nr:chaperone modulator CbpM [Acidimicrobiia bacterium]
MTQSMTRSRTTSLARRELLDLDSFARAASIQSDFARRLVVLGFVEARVGPGDELHFAPDQVAVAARMQRLRTGLALNYASLGLVADLLDRIAELERAARSPRKSQSTSRAESQPRTGGRSWT